MLETGPEEEKRSIKPGTKLAVRQGFEPEPFASHCLTVTGSSAHVHSRHRETTHVVASSVAQRSGLITAGR
jgi:hypothetical protein